MPDQYKETASSTHTLTPGMALRRKFSRPKILIFMTKLDNQRYGDRTLQAKVTSCILQLSTHAQAQPHIQTHRHTHTHTHTPMWLYITCWSYLHLLQEILHFISNTTRFKQFIKNTRSLLPSLKKTFAVAKVEFFAPFVRTPFSFWHKHEILCTMISGRRYLHIA